MDWIKGYLAGWTVAVIVAVISGWYACKGFAWMVETLARKMGYLKSSVVDGLVFVVIIGGSLMYAGYEHRQFTKHMERIERESANEVHDGQAIIRREADTYQ